MCFFLERGEHGLQHKHRPVSVACGAEKNKKTPRKMYDVESVVVVWALTFVFDTHAHETCTQSIVRRKPTKRACSSLVKTRRTWASRSSSRRKPCSTPSRSHSHVRNCLLQCSAERSIVAYRQPWTSLDEMGAGFERAQCVCSVVATDFMSVRFENELLPHRRFHFAGISILPANTRRPNANRASFHCSR